MNPRPSAAGTPSEGQDYYISNLIRCNIKNKAPKPPFSQGLGAFFGMLAAPGWLQRRLQAAKLYQPSALMPCSARTPALMPASTRGAWAALLKSKMEPICASCAG